MRSCLRVTALIIAAHTLISEVASAKTFTFSVGVTTITLEADEKYCRFDTKYVFDKAWLDFQVQVNKNSNEVLGAYTLCEDLGSLREGLGQSLNEWTVILAPSQGKEKSAPIAGLTTEILLNTLEKQFKKGVEFDSSEVTKRLNEALPGGEGSKPRLTVGDATPRFLAKDDTTIYASMILDISVDEDKTKIASVIGMSLVKQHVITLNVFKRYQGQKTIEALLNENKKLASQLATQS
ncbi:MAG: hypothetical protein COB37_06540 [Kordiimonadales bacterium]|nr:MAG: hypothetical protein COB37_06540 [Kordiimonadales bacterium]